MTVQKYKLKIWLQATEYPWYKSAVSLIKENPFAGINRVRHLNTPTKPNVTVEPELRTSIASSRDWRLNPSAFPLKRAPHAQWNNEIEKTESFLPFF